MAQEGDDMDRRKLAASLLSALLAAGTPLAGGLGASGCAREPRSETYPLIGAWTEGMRATDEQAQLARDMGCSEEEIARMREEGMSQNEFKNVAYAQWALDYLSARYGGQAFRALWLAKPEPLGRDNYILAAEVVGGPLDGEKVEVSFDEYGASGDSYWAMLHEADWEAYVTGALAPVVSGLPEGSCAVAANAAVSVDTRVTLGSSDAFEDHLDAITGDALVCVLPSAGMSDEDYDALVDALVEALSGSGTSVFLRVARLTSVPEGVDLPSEEQPWRSVDDDMYERLVKVNVYHTGQVDYFHDEREAG